MESGETQREMALMMCLRSAEVVHWSIEDDAATFELKYKQENEDEFVELRLLLLRDGGVWKVKLGEM